MYCRAGMICSVRSIATSTLRFKAEPDLITKAFLKQIQDLTAKQK